MIHSIENNHNNNYLPSILKNIKKNEKIMI